MLNITIRPATAADVPLIIRFIRELATYEKAPEQAVATEHQLEQALFCNNPRVYSVICEVDGNPAGFALFFYSFSTWLGVHGLFLEDLYVTPDYRGAGAGKALLKHLAQRAVREGCGRFEWNVLDWNRPAIDFYEAFGATPQSEWVGYRLAGDALAAFAESGD
jgi:GNAT superfamily N-acetyltransferase